MATRLTRCALAWAAGAWDLVLTVAYLGLLLGIGIAVVPYLWWRGDAPTPDAPRPARDDDDADPDDDDAA